MQVNLTSHGKQEQQDPEHHEMTLEKYGKQYLTSGLSNTTHDF